MFYFLFFYPQAISPENGVITGFSARPCDFQTSGFFWIRCQKKNLSFLGVYIGDFNYGRRSFSIDNLARKVTKGERLDIFRTNGSSWWEPWVFKSTRESRKSTMDITLNYVVEENTLKPQVEWDNNCPVEYIVL